MLRPQGQTPQGDHSQLDPVLQLGKIVAAADGYNLKKITNHNRFVNKMFDFVFENLCIPNICFTWASSCVNSRMSREARVTSMMQVPTKFLLRQLRNAGLINQVSFFFLPPLLVQNKACSMLIKIWNERRLSFLGSMMFSVHLLRNAMSSPGFFPYSEWIFIEVSEGFAESA